MKISYVYEPVPGRIDEKAIRVLLAVENKIRPYRERDIAMVTGLSKAVVRHRCRKLAEAEILQEKWVNLELFWELAPAYKSFKSLARIANTKGPNI